MAGPYDDLIGFLNTQHTELNAEKDKLAKIDDNKKRFQEELLALSTERKQAESRIEKLEENLRVRTIRTHPLKTGTDFSTAFRKYLPLYRSASIC